MEMQFLTLLNDNNDWIDWAELWFGELEGLETPVEFPCYASHECIGFDDLETEGDCMGDALFWPTFLYEKDVREMLERM